MKKLLDFILRFFRAGAAKVFEDIQSLVPIAMPIVEEIGKIAPTTEPARPDDEILAAYRRFAVPLSLDQLHATPATKKGYLLLQLATDVLARQYPSIATKVLNSAVQLAVAGLSK